MNAYRNIDRTKVQFDFLVFNKEPAHFDDEIRGLGGRIFYAPPWRRDAFGYKKAVKKILVENPEIKIVHAHDPFGGAFAFKVAGKRIFKIAHSHNTDYVRSRKGFKKFVIEYLLERFTRIADFRLACSENAGKYIHGKNKFKVVNNGVDVKKLEFNRNVRDKVRKELGLGDDLTIIDVARFVGQKNHCFLIHIFSELCKLKKNCRLLLVGEGPLEQEIKSKVSDLGVGDRVLFLGARDDIPQLLSAGDVFCMPSLYEGLGIVLIEAQASGLCCLTSTGVPSAAAVTDLVEFVDLQQGAKAWAEKILQVKLAEDRKKYNDDVIAAGYDAKDTAAYLQGLYLGS